MAKKKKSNKNLKIILFSLGGIILLAIGLFFILNIKDNTPQYVGDFTITSEDSNFFEVRFGFFNEEKEYVKTSGNGNLKIINDENEEVFNMDFDFNETDFKTYTNMFSNSEILSATFSLGKEDITKTKETSGTGHLSISLEDGTYFETLETSIYGLPTYSTEELSEMKEQEYSQEKIEINKEITSGKFKIQFLSSGFFIEESWLGSEEYYRIDMKVQNTGNEKDTLSMSDLAIITPNGYQYERSYGGTLDTSYDSYYPGITKEGYVLFEGVPKGESYTLAYTMGYDENWEPIYYTLKI